jgi:very-short-patch-repair endonuclease
VVEVANLDSRYPSPLVGEGRGPRAKRVGRVRGNADGLTKRQLLPATTVSRSRELRRNAGPVERALRSALRRSLPGAKFRWQVPFGPYHADFCSHAAKLIVEVDDATHVDRRDHDEARTRFLNTEGYRVLRFWNNDVMGNVEGVVAKIAADLPLELRGSFA